MDDVGRALWTEPGSLGSGHIRQVGRAYAVSLLWIALSFAVAICVSNVTELVFVDFVHVNPHRTKENAVEMMWLFSILLGGTAIIGCFLVFGLPQIVQAMLHAQARRLSWPFSCLIVVALVPVTAVLTWYSWEYLTPTDVNLGINEGPEWRPYQHGITVERYLDALAFQLPVALYSLVYCDPTLIRTSRRILILLGLATAIPVGVWYGHRLAEGQYRFL